MACNPTVPSDAVPDRMTPVGGALLVLRKGNKEAINRQMPAGGPPTGQEMQRPLVTGHIVVRLDHVDMIRFQDHSVFDLEDGHLRCLGE
jgi:hypothetical protein